MVSGGGRMIQCISKTSLLFSALLSDLLASILLTWTEFPYELRGTLLYIVHMHMYIQIEEHKFYYLTTLTIILLNGYKNLPLCFTKVINRVTPVGCFRQKAQAAQLHTHDMPHAPHLLMANSHSGIRFKLPETPSSPSAVIAATALSQAPRYVFSAPPPRQHPPAGWGPEI